MTPQEANKIIAEYMDNENPVPVNIDELSDSQKKTYQPYAYNLNRLVPVWEKLGHYALPEIERHQMYRSNGDKYTTWRARYKMQFGFSETSIQEAAAIATAKVIQELKN